MGSECCILAHDLGTTGNKATLFVPTFFMATPVDPGSGETRLISPAAAVGATVKLCGSDHQLRMS